MNNCKSNEDSKQFAQLCRNELQLTENCLRVNPKSYCVWHQRSWIIKQMPNPDLKMEIALCNQCLQLDERNCKLKQMSNYNLIKYIESILYF